MANQRVLDDNENDKSTKDGASDQRSHHEDVLGHILEDTSLDEWDIVPDVQQSVAPPDIVATEIPVADSSVAGASVPDVPVADVLVDAAISSASVSDIQDIQPPEDEWAASEIVPLPEIQSAPKEESSLFSFSMMQKFGSELEEPTRAEPVPAAFSTPIEQIPPAVEPIPAPVEPPPAPVEPPPAPIEPIPAPIEPLPAPVEPVPAPVEPLPAPVEPLPAPVETISVEVEKAHGDKIPTIDPLLVPAPPVAIGPNPFLVKLATLQVPVTTPIAETPTASPIAEAPTNASPIAEGTTASPIAEDTTASPVAEAPTASPIAEGPTASPVAEGPTASPVAEAPKPQPAVHSPSAASTRIPALAPTPAMILAQTQSAPPPTPASTPPAPTPSVPTPKSETAPAQPKRKPAATLIFDSFTKSKIESSGIDLLNPFNLSAKSSTNAAPNAAPTAPTAAPTAAPSTPPKQRNTARTLIFKAGMPVDEMDQSLHPPSPPTQDHATTTGSNPTINVNPSVGPNLAAAIAAYQAAGPAPEAIPVSTDAAARSNSNVIPAHSPATGGRPIARTMILKSLAKPEPEELEEPLTEPLLAPQDGRPSPETIIAAGHAAEAAEAADAQAAEAGRPKMAKRSTAPTLIFKAFTLPSAGDNAKPAPLKIIRYDSSKLRNLETNAKPLSIAESIAAAKQASLTDNDKNGPQWLKLVTANPLLKSPKFRSAALLIILSSALLVCAFALVKSLYSDGEDYHPTSVTSAVRDQHHYRSADGSKSFDLLDKDKGSVLTHNGKAIHGKIKTVSDADLIALASAPVPKREIWLQKTDAGYVDGEGTTLYSASAPELTITKKIDSYASILAAKYKETKLYPSDAERFERMSPKDFRFTNPFTGHVDQPVVLYKRFAAAEPSWTDHTRAGHAWADEPPFKPGAIHCVCLDYCRFFMRGFDRNGNPIYGSTPGVADYIELKDGQNMNPRRNDKVTDDKDKTPAVFMVTRNPGLQMEVALLRQIGLLVPATILVVALLAGCWILFLRRMKNNKADSLANTTKFTIKQ